MTLQDDLLKEIKILYVEDDPMTAEELSRFLKRRAGRVNVAYDGMEALEMFAQDPPDIIIADLFLPKLSGVDMVRKIREQGHQTPVIIISAVDDSNVILSAVDTGILKYHLKPIDTDELLRELNQLAEKILSEEKAPTEVRFSNKKELEGQIKKKFSALLKSYTGKGPKDVSVLIAAGCVEIISTEILTVYEKTLLDNYQNIVIIEQNRRLFYQIMEPRISRILEDILHAPVSLVETQVSPRDDRNKLIFRIET
ncbi:MAG: Na-translocating system protein MpsC family protein [Anaerovoracaceae bacterium]|jgi:YesN/AraC family two-component response regulator